MPYTKPLTKIGREDERRQKRTLIFREAVGGRLAALRMQKKDIAELTGLAESTIRRWLNEDVGIMNVDALAKFMQALQIPRETIIEMLEVK